MNFNPKSFVLFRSSADILNLIFCFYFALFITNKGISNFFIFNEYILLLLLIVVWLFSSKQTYLYDDFRSSNFSKESVLVIKNIFIQVLAAIVILFLVKEIKLNRLFVIIYSPLLFLIIPQKILLKKLLKYFRKRGINIKKLLIVGAGELGYDLHDLILSTPHYGYKLVGFVDDLPRKELNGSYLGKISELDNILNSTLIDDAIIALPDYKEDVISNIIESCERHTANVKIIPECFKFLSEKYQFIQFGRFPLISVRNEQINELHSRLLKRIFDILLTIDIYLVILSWLMPIIAIAIKLTSSGPILYKAERWSRKNKKITIYKFRTMYTGCKTTDENGRHLQAQRIDPRVTKIGKFLRKTNLDELPQFWNILKGEMSIVGPRPHSTPLNYQSQNEVKHYMMRHIVKPGLTGWAQVNGFRGPTNDPKLMQKRVEYDLFYIENWSIWFDVQIILLTLRRMLQGDPNAY